MKIIKIGKPPESAKNWWDGITAQCPTCGSTFMLENHDLVFTYFHDKQFTNGRVHCPTENCGELVWFDHPSKKDKKIGF